MKKTLAHMAYLHRGVAALSVVMSATTTLGQGTVLFSGQVGLYGTNYYEQGVWFRVVVPTRGTGSPDYDSMGIAPAVTSPSNIPYNRTPYMLFFQQFSPDDYVVFSLTNASTFGLGSVQLADAVSPSLSPVSITFSGLRNDGSEVSTTFTTPGNGADTLQTYPFGPAFASGLTRVEIHSSRWAMDNLVWVPEPGIGGLLVLGFLALAGRHRWHAQRTR